MGPPLAASGGPPLRTRARGRDLRGRHAAADGVGLAARRPRLQLHADRRARALPAHARQATSSTRWAGTTTGCRPSAACRTTSTCAATRTSPYEPGLVLDDGRRGRAQGAAAPRLAPELHRALPRAHGRGRAGLQGAVAAARALGRLGARVLDDRRALPAPRAVRASSISSARATSTRSRRRRCGTSTSGRPSRRPRSRTARCAGAFHDLASASRAAASFVIATTRPELLPACVGVTAHPDDARYRALFGKRAVTPLFRVPVPIFPSELVDPEKGTGILMVCTFGDATDVQWWREQALALRQIDRPRRPPRARSTSAARPSRASTRRARTAPTPSSPARPSREAQKAIVELLREPGAAAAGGGSAPLVGGAAADRARGEVLREGRPAARVRHDAPVVRALLEHKQELVEAGDRDRAGTRTSCACASANWTENLNLDWCISRQRYFGVPFPVWYPLDARTARTDYAQPIAAPTRERCRSTRRRTCRRATARRSATSPAASRPRPTSSTPGSPARSRRRSRPAGCSTPERHRRLFPMDLRPQSHEIIRTWAFYTIAKALLHEDRSPGATWRSRAGCSTPTARRCRRARATWSRPLHLLDQYGADAVRYWSLAAPARRRHGLRREGA